MDKRKRELIRLVARHDVELVDIQVTGGSHYKLTLRVGPTTRKIFTAFSASDWRARRNLSATIRRMTNEVNA